MITLAVTITGTVVAVTLAMKWRKAERQVERLTALLVEIPSTGNTQWERWEQNYNFDRLGEEN